MMGLPMIAPNYPGMLPLVEGEGVGLCVAPDSPRAIAEAVNRLASRSGAPGTDAGQRPAAVEGAI